LPRRADGAHDPPPASQRTGTIGPSATSHSASNSALAAHETTSPKRATAGPFRASAPQRCRELPVSIASPTIAARAISTDKRFSAPQPFFSCEARGALGTERLNAQNFRSRMSSTAKSTLTS
jgi:hypothetical protein